MYVSIDYIDRENFIFQPALNCIYIYIFVITAIIHHSDLSTHKLYLNKHIIEVIQTYTNFIISVYISTCVV